MAQVAKDDILVNFEVGGVPVFQLRIASRHGHDTAPNVQRRLQELLKLGTATCSVEVITPSRFSPSK